jgi:glycosyltransferase involved in cell wall biosynthesis
VIAGKTILCLASGYDAPPTSKHHVMHLLARDNVVLWVNYHASRKPSATASDGTYIVRKLAEVAGGLRRRRPNLFVLTPLVLPLPGAPWARRANRVLLIAQIRRALAAVRNGPLQIWSFTPDVAYALGHFAEERVVYYCVDDHASFSGYDREQVLRDEEELCRRSDLVVTTSIALQEAKAPLNPNTVLLPHGVDYGHFSRALSADLPEPADLAGIPRPRLGFFGLIRDWVDLDLLAAVARRRADWHFVLLGDSTVDLSPYRPLANMHFLGRKPYEQLPAYCRGFDVGLIPFQVNELTRAVNPIKLREYLAAGLPVVSTPMPEVRLYERLVAVADGEEEFEAAIQRALDGGPFGRVDRSRAMAEESWPAKLERLHQRLASDRGSEAKEAALP